MSELELDIEPVQTAIRDWVVAGSGLTRAKVYWGQQDSQRPPEPAIEMRLLATHTLGMAWLSTEDQVYSFPPLPVAAVSVNANTLKIPNHGLTNGDGPVHVVSTGSVPGGLAAIRDYWVILIDADTIQLARSFADTGGAAPSGNPITPIVLTSTGTGTTRVVATPATTRGAAPLRYVSRSRERLGVMLTSRTSEAIGMASAIGYLSRVKAAQRLPGQQAILKRAGIGLTDVERARAIHGTRNAVMFEPRAIMEVYFSLPTEMSEDGQVIERAQVRRARPVLESPPIPGVE